MDTPRTVVISEAAESVNRAVGAQLRGYRMAKDMTQRDVVEATGIDLSSLRRYERGKRDIPVAVVHVICTALGTSLLEIMRRAVEADPGVFTGGLTDGQVTRHGETISAEPEIQRMPESSERPSKPRRAPRRG